MGEYSNSDYLERMERHSNRRTAAYNFEAKSVIKLKNELKEKIKLLEGKTYNYASKNNKSELRSRASTQDLRRFL